MTVAQFRCYAAQMTRREITAAVLSLGGAAGLAAMTQVGATVFPHREGLIFNIGLAGSIACIFGLVILWMGPGKRNDGPIDHQENVTMGDTYNNSGTNFGHIGPINIGKQEFQLTDAHLREIVQRLPKSKPVAIYAVGGSRASQMGRQVQSAVEQAGLHVAAFNMIGVMSPPPEAPLSIDDRGDHVGITVAPNA
jgi:hypothetical protein